MKNNSKIIFFCSNCGNEYAKWSGQCPACKSWGNLKEIKFSQNKTSNSRNNPPPQLLSFDKIINEDSVKRQPSGLKDIDEILGGGIMPSSIILFGGEPGIGKSTLALQIGGSIDNCLYISAEESESQVANRAKRINILSQNLNFSSENKWEQIQKVIQISCPNLIVIDSIQTIYSEVLEGFPGSMSQVRECGTQILEFCKKSQISAIIIGHITKDGKIAGPKTLEHMVDVVINMEGNSKTDFRTVRTIKNRFGSTNNTAIFEMTETGLLSINNPSKFFLSERLIAVSGSVVVPIIEGNQPIMIEVQGLVSSATYGNPQRNTTGFDMRRLSMLLAILDKKLSFKTNTNDVFLNIVGGLKINEPALDLAVIIAIISSNRDIPINPNIAVCGEVGLSGEIRSITHIDRRINESKKSGFKEIICPAQNINKYKNIPKIKLIGVKSVSEALRYLKLY